MPNVSRIELYSSDWCGFCARAKQLLESKGVDYIEYSVDADIERRTEMMSRSGRHTVPQIFIDDRSVGGCDELFALERTGRLDAMLGEGSGS